MASLCRPAKTWIVATVLAVLVGTTACRTISPPPSPPVFYPPAPDQPRIQYLRSFTSRSDVGGRKYAWLDWVVGPAETSRMSFFKPYGLAVARGRFYVCDTILGTVWLVDFAQGVFQPIAGDRGQGKLKKPINLAVDGDGRKYVTDIDRGQVVVYGPDDQYVAAFGEGPPPAPSAAAAGSDKVQGFRPGDVAVAGDRLVVSDLAGNEIQVRDKRTGEIMRTFGSPQTTPIEEALGLPVNLDVDGRGNIVVSDSGRFRICVYAPDGAFLGAFGEIGRNAGQFARPKGIAVDREGRIYVVDAAFENVQVFDEAHRLLMWFGGHGRNEGDLSLPAQVAIDYENVDWFRRYVAPGFDLEYVIWVTSQSGSRLVSCYGFLRPKTAEAPRK